MKRALVRTTEIYYYKDGKKIIGKPDNVFGDLTGVRGNLYGVRGDLSGVRGNLYGVRGDLTGVSGDLSEVRGDLDDCEITKAERKKGINIVELIKE